jgi:hypothetical protein
MAGITELEFAFALHVSHPSKTDTLKVLYILIFAFRHEMGNQKILN